MYKAAIKPMQLKTMSEKESISRKLDLKLKSYNSFIKQTEKKTMKEKVLMKKILINKYKITAKGKW